MINTNDYRTKTFFLERENASAENAWVIGLDAGYSSVKCISPNIVCSFPSIARPLKGTGFIGSLPDECIRYRNLENGQEWIVGQMAQDTLSDGDTTISERALYSRDRYENPMFKVLIETGIGLSCMTNRYGSPGKKEIIIQTGLPLEYIEEGGSAVRDAVDSDRQRLLDVIAGEHAFSLRIGQGPETRFAITIDPKNVYTISQPRGTLFSAAIDSAGRPLKNAADLFSKKGIVFDVGFGTLDIFSLKNNTVDGGQTWPDLGMRAVMAETSRLIREREGLQIPVPALLKYLEDGKVRLHKGRVSKDVPFAAHLEEASRKICREAVDRLFATYPMYEYDYMIVTGGTGDAWKDYIREELKDMETLKVMNGDANDTLPMIFANVRGFYLYRLMTIRTGRRT